MKDNRLYEVVVQMCNAISRLTSDHQLSDDQKQALDIAYFAMSLIYLKPGVCDRRDLIKLIQVKAGGLK